MKKNELVHLHALLALVARDLLARGEARPEDFAAYDALGVTPMSLRSPRDDHEAAVLALSRGMAAALGDERARAKLDSTTAV